MIQYAEIKPTVYLESTVVSYLTSRPSNNIVISSRQQATQQLWNEYSSATISTPKELIEGTRMKEEPTPPTDPILEEYYRMKEEFNAQFNSIEELNAYLMEIQKREKARGRKYIPAPPPPPGAMEKMEKMLKELKKDSD